ncbi:MAG: GspH/FimT family pseudopilin [Candidatus Thiodiazotropha sp. LLP2]
MKGTKGFTLIELLMAVIVAAILVAIAIPAFIDMTEQNAVSTTSNELLGGLLLARSEAVRQEELTTFTPLNDGWQVDAAGVNLLTHVVDNVNLTIDGDPITYNARGRAALDNTESIEISYEGTVQSRICLSLTGRPFIRSVENGACP